MSIPTPTYEYPPKFGTYFYEKVGIQYSPPSPAQQKLDEEIIQLCREDFWRELAKAVAAAGGTPSAIGRWKMLSLQEVVDILAQNGIRMTYDPAWHFDNILDYLGSRRDMEKQQEQK